MLNIHEIDVFYGGIKVLKNVSLIVHEGTISVLLGTNGSGKSTLMKTISGLLRPRTGTIEFLSQKIERLSPDQIVRLGISHVPEGRWIFPELTVKENLLMGAFLLNKKEIQRNLTYTQEVFPILALRLHQMAGTLSGGEQQMLAIGRALMAKPRFLLMDEPSHGLAPLLIQEIFKTTLFLREKGTTILLAEQNCNQALSLANQGYVLMNGSVALQGLVSDLLRNDEVKRLYFGESIEPMNGL